MTKDCEGCGPEEQKQQKQHPGVMSMSPDEDLAAELRQDFTAKHCVEALMQAAAEMAAAIGVTVSWEVAKVEDVDVDRQRLSRALGRLATSGGAMLVGGKINPIRSLKAHDPLQVIRERKRNA